MLEPLLIAHAPGFRDESATTKASDTLMLFEMTTLRARGETAEVSIWPPRPTHRAAKRLKHVLENKRLRSPPSERSGVRQR